VEQARAAGFEMFCAPEVEFFYFANSDTTSPPVPLDQASYFDLTTADVASDLRKQTLHMLEALSIPVEYSFHEDSPSQHEIDLQYTDALSMADSIMTLRLAVKKIAMDRGVYATFMPKPLNGVQGSGMHTHLSLFRDGANAFHDPDAEDGLSQTARAFIAGLLHHAREITAVTNQLVNSYKRINEGYEAPRYVSWARNNRSALVRVPIPKPGKVDSTRIEYRAVDPACNPYLAFSVLLAAGLRGVEEGLELGPEARVNLYDLSRVEQRELGVAGLPANLSEALDEMEESTLVRDALGDHIFEWFLRNKRAEWSEYQRQVTPFELETYLPNW
jgi:glutamine synthetase